MQTDSNLVLYENGTALWATSTNYTGAVTAIMQTDGNFVEYDASNAPQWASNTAGNPGAYLAVQTDGNVVIYSSSGAALWSTNTGGH